MDPLQLAQKIRNIDTSRLRKAANDLGSYAVNKLLLLDRDPARGVSDTLDSAADAAEAERIRQAAAQLRGPARAPVTGNATREYDPSRPPAIDVAARANAASEQAFEGSRWQEIANEINQQIEDATAPAAGALGISTQLIPARSPAVVAGVLEAAVQKYGSDAVNAIRRVVAPSHGIEFDPDMPLDAITEGIAASQFASWDARMQAARSTPVEQALDPVGRQINPPEAATSSTDRPALPPIGPRPPAPSQEMLVPLITSENSLVPIQELNPATGLPRIDADGNPITSTNAGGIPRLQPQNVRRVQAARLLPEAQRQKSPVDRSWIRWARDQIAGNRAPTRSVVTGVRDSLVPVDGEEFTTIKVGRGDSNGNDSAEARAWLRDMGDGQYQYTTYDDAGAPVHQVVDKKFLTDLAHQGFVYEGGPYIPALRPAQWDEASAANLGRELFESMQPGSNPVNVSQLVEEMQQLRQVGDGSLFRVALDNAGFRAGPDPAAREAAGNALFDQAAAIAPPAPGLNSGAGYATRNDGPAPRVENVSESVLARLDPASRMLGAGRGTASPTMAPDLSFSGDTSGPVSGAYPFFENSVEGLDPSLGSAGSRVDQMFGSRSPAGAGAFNFNVEPGSWADQQARSPLDNLVGTPSTFTTTSMDFGAIGGERARLDAVGARLREVTDQLRAMRAGAGYAMPAKKNAELLPGEAALRAEQEQLLTQADELEAALKGRQYGVAAALGSSPARTSPVLAAADVPRFGVGDWQSRVMGPAGQEVTPNATMFGPDGRTALMPKWIPQTTDPNMPAVQQALPDGSVRLPEQPTRVTPGGVGPLLDRARAAAAKARNLSSGPGTTARPISKTQAELEALADEEASIIAYKGFKAYADDEAGDLASDALSHVSATKRLATYAPYARLSPDAKARVIAASGDPSDVRARISAIDPESTIDYDKAGMPIVRSPRADAERAQASSYRNLASTITQDVNDAARAVQLDAEQSPDAPIDRKAAKRQAAFEAETQNLNDKQAAEMASRVREPDLSVDEQRAVVREVLGLDDDYAIKTEPDNVTIHPDTGGIILPEISEGASRPVRRRTPPAFQLSLENRDPNGRPSEATLDRLRRATEKLEQERDAAIAALDEQTVTLTPKLREKAVRRIERAYRAQVSKLATSFAGGSDVATHSSAANRARLIEKLTTTTGPARIEVIRELFGDNLSDGFENLRKLAADGRLGSMEDIVARTLKSHAEISDPAKARGSAGVVTESGERYDSGVRAYTPDGIRRIAGDVVRDVEYSIANPTAKRVAPPPAPPQPSLDQRVLKYVTDTVTAPVRGAIARLQKLGTKSFSGPVADTAEPLLKALPPEAEILAAGTDRDKLNALLSRVNQTAENADKVVAARRAAGAEDIDMSEFEAARDDLRNLIFEQMGPQEVNSGAGGYTPPAKPQPAAIPYREAQQSPGVAAVIGKQSEAEVKRTILRQIKSESPNQASDKSWLKQELARRWKQFTESPAGATFRDKTGLPIEPAESRDVRIEKHSLRMAANDAEQLRHYLTPSFYLGDKARPNPSALLSDVAGWDELPPATRAILESGDAEAIRAHHQEITRALDVADRKYGPLHDAEDETLRGLVHALPFVDRARKHVDTFAAPQLVGTPTISVERGVGNKRTVTVTGTFRTPDGWSWNAANGGPSAKPTFQKGATFTQTRTLPAESDDIDAPLGPGSISVGIRPDGVPMFFASTRLPSATVDARTAADAAAIKPAAAEPRMPARQLPGEAAAAEVRRAQAAREAAATPQETAETSAAAREDAVQHTDEGSVRDQQPDNPPADGTGKSVGAAEEAVDDGVRHTTAATGTGSEDPAPRRGAPSKQNTPQKGAVRKLATRSATASVVALAGVGALNAGKRYVPGLEAGLSGQAYGGDIPAGTSSAGRAGDRKAETEEAGIQDTAAVEDRIRAIRGGRRAKFFTSQNPFPR
jgi:hypothetical protein